MRRLKKNTVLLGLDQEKWALILIMKDLELEERSSNSGPAVSQSV